jgi:purine-nucleoside phosphorylase
MTVTTATDPMGAAREAAAVLAAKTGADRHEVALVLGSGWVPAVDAVAGEYEQFPEEVLEAGRQAPTRAGGLLGQLISRL